MPRVGRHPLKTSIEVTTSPPKEITVTTIVHIPTLRGYWEQSLEVLRLFFDSLLQSTDIPFDLMVFDNRSCCEVHDYLLSLYRNECIQFLFLSKYNLRKTGALEFLLSRAPGKIIAYADSDVYFLPGWLEASLQVLEKFPEAGQITAIPIAHNVADWAYTATLDGINKDPLTRVQISDNLIPDEFIEAHAKSIGMPVDIYKQRRLANRQDILISRDNVQAFVAACDLQFITTRDVIQAIQPLTNNQDIARPGDQIYTPVLEERLNQKGFWRLSTTDYLVHHMGNRVPNFEEELPWVDPSILPGPGPSTLEPRRRRHRLLQSPRFRGVLKRINILTYKWLYEQ